MGCETAGWKMPIHTDFLQWAILTLEVGQTDLVVGVQSGFISRSVHARLQTSLYAASTICATLVNIQTDTQTHTHRQHLTSLYEKLSQLS